MKYGYVVVGAVAGTATYILTEDAIPDKVARAEVSLGIFAAVSGILWLYITL